MKVAIVSDVHSNRRAWGAVLEDLHEREADAVWGLGDWLGYKKDDPIALWLDLKMQETRGLGELIRHPDQCCVIGNHDLALLARDDQELTALYSRYPFQDQAKNAISYQREVVLHSRVWKEEFRPWLAAQPYVLSPLPGVYLAHGGFPERSNVEEAAHWYTPDRYSHERSWSALQAWSGAGTSIESENGLVHCPSNTWAPPLLIFTGHTHKQAVWQREEAMCNGRWRTSPRSRIPWEVICSCGEQQKPVEWHLELAPTSESPIWINPGSVGRPRDIDKASPELYWAKYALLDWQGKSGILWLRWVPYGED